MCLNVKKSQVLRIGKWHVRKVNCLVINGSPVEFVAQMKYLGWYILSGNAFRVSLHYMHVRFYQCFNSLFARGSNFSEPVLQHLVIRGPTCCKPYLLYGCEVIIWSKSELCNISYAFNSVL